MKCMECGHVTHQDQSERSKRNKWDEADMMIGCCSTLIDLIGCFKRREGVPSSKLELIKLQGAIQYMSRGQMQPFHWLEGPLLVVYWLVLVNVIMPFLWSCSSLSSTVVYIVQRLYTQGNYPRNTNVLYILVGSHIFSCGWTSHVTDELKSRDAYLQQRQI